jgi:hypothetical protein
MLSMPEYLAECVSEEASEVGQIIGKAQRFGIEDIRKGHEQSNLEHLESEMHDLLTAYDLLMSEINADPFTVRPHLIQAKTTRIYDYMLLSYINNRVDIKDHLYTVIRHISIGGTLRAVLLRHIVNGVTKESVLKCVTAVYEYESDHEFLGAALLKLSKSF